ncbi:MAG: GGDEF domain-containing protein [Patescibacteria group bacterium]
MKEGFGDRIRRFVDNLGTPQKFGPGWTSESTQVAAGFESKKAIEKLKALATIDDLTGLENIRSFKERMEKAFISLYRVEKHRTNETPVISIAMGDIDNFKLINDAYGHPTGDRVLQAVAKVLKDGMRGDGNSAARYGGEEFVFGFIGLDEDKALKKIIERIREEIEKLQIRSDDGKIIPVTMSFGVTSTKNDAQTLDGAIRQADAALSKAKKTDGKNCAVLFSTTA